MVVVLALLFSAVLSANPTNAPADRACSQCHTGTAENPGRILIEFAAFQYTPGVQQQVKVHILQNRLPGATNFQMTARLASNELADAGTFIGSSTTQILTQNGRPYITNNGLNGTTVQLVWAGPDGDLNTTADNIDYTTTTNLGGLYYFCGVINGTYKITVLTPAMMTPTKADQGGNNVLDSDGPVVARDRESRCSGLPAHAWSRYASRCAGVSH